MQRIFDSIRAKAVVVSVLSMSFANYPQFCLSAKPLGANVAIKTQSQYRAEAARYDSAIRALAGISTTKLDTPDDLKKAHEIVAAAIPALKLYRSKFVVLTLSDTRFASSVKKRSPNKRAAEELIKEINADRKAVLKLSGGEELRTRIEQSIRADVAVIRQASERLKAAGEKLKNSQAQEVDRSGRAFKVVQTRFARPDLDLATHPDLSATSISPQDPFTLAIAIIAAIAIGVVLYEFIFFGVVLVLEEDKGDSEDCFNDANSKYESCENSARSQPFPLNIAQLIICDSLLLARQAACLIR